MNNCDSRGALSSDICTLAHGHHGRHAAGSISWSRTDDQPMGHHPWYCPRHNSWHGLWQPRPVCG
jgi:hypothetical protein